MSVLVFFFLVDIKTFSEILRVMNSSIQIKISSHLISLSVSMSGTIILHIMVSVRRIESGT